MPNHPGLGLMDIAMAAPSFLTYEQKRAVLAVAHLETGNTWLTRAIFDCDHAIAWPDLKRDQVGWFLREDLRPTYDYASERGYIDVINGKGYAKGKLLALDHDVLDELGHYALYNQGDSAIPALGFGPTMRYGGAMIKESRTVAFLTDWLPGDLRHVWRHQVSYLWMQRAIPKDPDNEAEVRVWLGVHYSGGNHQATSQQYQHWYDAYGKVGF